MGIHYKAFYKHLIQQKLYQTDSIIRTRVKTLERECRDQLCYIKIFDKNKINYYL